MLELETDGSSRNNRLKKSLSESQVCCNVQMVGLEFGVNNMESRLHPASDQQVRLLPV